MLIVSKERMEDGEEDWDNSGGDGWREKDGGMG